MEKQVTFTIKFNVEPPNVQQAMDAINASLQQVGVNVGELNTELTTNTKTTDANSESVKKSKTFYQEHRGVIREQRFYFRELSGAMMAVQLGLGFLMNAEEGQSESQKKLNKGLQEGFMAFQGLGMTLSMLQVPGGIAIAAIIGIGIAAAEMLGKVKPSKEELKALREEMDKFNEGIGTKQALIEYKQNEVAIKANQNAVAALNEELKKESMTIKDKLGIDHIAYTDRGNQIKKEIGQKNDLIASFIEENKSKQDVINKENQSTAVKQRQTGVILAQGESIDALNAKQKELEESAKKVDQGTEEGRKKYLSLGNQIDELKLKIENLSRTENEAAKKKLDIYAKQLEAQGELEVANTQAEMDANKATEVARVQIGEENARYLAQKKIDEMRMQDKEKDVRDEFDLSEQLDTAKKKQAADEINYFNETDKENRKSLKNQLDIDKAKIDSIKAKILARKQALEQEMAAGAQAYDAEKNFGVQLNQVTNQAIRAYIARAVMSYLASIIEITGPLALILAPIAGLAMEAMLESIIPKFGTGGSIYGQSGMDKIPAMLTHGEFIVRKEVAEPNRLFLEAMNTGNISMIRRANGGSVGTYPTAGSDRMGIIDLKKEFTALRKQLKNLSPQVIINSKTDWQKYDRIDKQLQRQRIAYAL